MATNGDEGSVADVLFPFFLLLSITISLLARKVFPFITKAELLFFQFWVPAFFLLIIIVYEKVNADSDSVKKRPIELLRSFLIASIGASFLTVYMK